MIDFKTMFLPSTIKAKQTVHAWQEAVYLAGQMMVAAGAIEFRYIEAMERVLRELGPYPVIAPGIVLLHARPEDGVVRPCLGLVSLSTPVPFGHSQNDPVDLVFVLGAIDKNSHIQALQHLASLLSDSACLARMRAANDDGALYTVIQSWPGDSLPGN